MLPLSISLSGEPTGKGRPRFSTRGGFARAFTPEKTRRYEDMLRILAQEQMQGAAPEEGPVEVEVVARFSIPASWSKKKQAAALAGEIAPTKKPDADNLLKVLDALNGVVWRDDAQVVSARVMKVYAEAPCFAITIRRRYAGRPA